MQVKMEEMLAPLIANDNEFQKTYSFSMLLKEYTVSKWMWEMNFGYRPEKKSYMINIHERADMVKDREEHYLPAHFENKLQESCWFQIKDETLMQQLTKFYGRSKERDKIYETLIESAFELEILKSDFSLLLDLNVDLDKVVTVSSCIEAIFSPTLLIETCNSLVM